MAADRKVVVIIVAVVIAALFMCCCGGTGIFLLLGSSGSSTDLKVIKGEDSPKDLVTLQISLEKSVYAYQRAKTMTAAMLATDPTKVPKAEWVASYQAAQAAWADAAAASDSFADYAVQVPERPDPSASAGSSMALPSTEFFAFGPTPAYAADELPLDITAYKTSEDSEVSLDMTNEAKAVIGDRAKRTAVVTTYNQAPSGAKLKTVADFMGTDAREAQKYLAETFASCSKAYGDEAKYYENAWRTATAIEAAADVALFVGDLATGGGKVGLTKAVGGTMLKKLFNPARLAKNMGKAMKDDAFTTVVGGADTVIGLYNKGVVIATGDEAATFSLTNDASSGISMLLTLKNLGKDAGALSNLTDLSKLPSTWKAAWGWGSLTGKVVQTGVNGLAIDASGEGMSVEPAPVAFTEDDASPDPGIMAVEPSQKAYDELNALEVAYAESLVKLPANPAAPEGEGDAQSPTFEGRYAGNALVGNREGHLTPMPVVMDVRDDGTFTATLSYSGKLPEWNRAEGSVPFSGSHWKGTFKGTVSSTGAVSGSGPLDWAVLYVDGKNPPANSGTGTFNGQIDGETVTAALKHPSWLGMPITVTLRKK